MVGKLGFDDRLEQDDFEGVDEDEWVSMLSSFVRNHSFSPLFNVLRYNIQYRGFSNLTRGNK